jgi:Na+-transporting NADH:ubiquinone oxidoreductase subunit B
MMATVATQTRSDRPVTDEAPHLRGNWSGDRIAIAALVALLPPLAAALYERGAAPLPPIVLSAVVVVGWQALFAWWRRRHLSADGFVTALVFTLMLPPGAPAWQLIVALSFGVVVGQQIFGGRGRNFVDPAVVALAFLVFSFPGAGYEAGGPGLALASLPGALFLVVTGLISWRILAAAAVGFVAGAYLLGVEDPLAQLIVGSFVFGVVFLACEPVAAASTNPGRWLYGLIVGGLTILGRTGGAGDGTVFAVLLASVFAPLIDQAVVSVNVWRRRRRHG